MSLPCLSLIFLTRTTSTSLRQYPSRYLFWKAEISMNTVSSANKLATESTDKLTELIWQDALRHLESTNNEVLLPVNITDMIGQSNVNKIKARLCALIDAPVVAFIDESINALRVMRTPAFSGSAVSVASHERISNINKGSSEAARRLSGKAAMSVKAAKVPRPPNAFILYRQHHHPQIKESYPQLSNNEISIILGKQWKAESDEIQVHFRNMAEDLKKKHAEDHPDYHYSPRKPSEKKRRASSRQLPKVVQNLESPASTNGTSTASTPALQLEMQAEGAAMAATSAFNMVFSPSEVPEEQLNFDTDAFDSLIQQVQDDYNKSMMYTHFGYPNDHVGDSFEFSEFVANDF
ncbi:hypothetical protein FE257_008720 [Aspergillus nanangensis]|uniref:HMG box domain-containing protein n=1 Tax=Aspergillus nanangensis TaxID=2582783 RepID=A0AAD4CLC4_ASPNN|nr:hypothetical protein FE257_008720 [Aspergillus nanangensis]